MLESLRRIIRDPAGTYFAACDKLMLQRTLLPYAVGPLLTLEFRDVLLSHVPGGRIEPKEPEIATPFPGYDNYGGLQLSLAGAVLDAAGLPIHTATTPYDIFNLPRWHVLRYRTTAPQWLQDTFEAAAPDRSRTKFDCLYTTDEGYVIYCTRFAAGSSLVRVFARKPHAPDATNDVDRISSGMLYLGSRFIQGHLYDIGPEYRSRWISAAVILTRELNM